MPNEKGIDEGVAVITEWFSDLSHWIIKTILLPIDTIRAFFNL